MPCMSLPHRVPWPRSSNAITASGCHRMRCAALSARVAHPDKAVTTVRSPLDAESADGELQESMHCTFVNKATETSRRVDDGTSHVLHCVPYPREHNINTEVAFALSLEEPHHALSSTRVLILNRNRGSTQRRCEHVCHDASIQSFFVFAPNTGTLSRQVDTRVITVRRPFTAIDTSTLNVPPPLASFKNAKLHVFIEEFQSPSSTGWNCGCSSVLSWVAQW